MDAKVAVAIGVGSAGRLARLPGAINGAKRFHAWAEDQGYKSHLITDERAPVTVAMLKSRFRQVVNEGEARRLLIYFAGHGIQPSVNTAFWLLSQWEDDSDEAVNVNLSFANAKRSGIYQIGVFSDACRSVVQDGPYVGGSSIFPKPPISLGTTPHWDHFLASRLGEVAQEVPGQDAAYGIFTRCVMRALSGLAEEAIEIRTQRNPPHVVTSAKLGAYLDMALPLESGRTPGAVVQFPEIITGWRSPDDEYIALEESRVVAPALSRTTRASRRASAAELSVQAARQKIQEIQNEDAASFSANRKRLSFEAQQGLVVAGDRPAKVVGATHKQYEVHSVGRLTHVTALGEHPQTVLVQLVSGNLIPIIIIPNFVATLVVTNQAAASINYSPTCSQVAEEPGFDRISRVVDRWTAAMKQGTVGDYSELKAAADQLRQYKHSDPTLGILSAYAYERVGDIREIDRIVHYFLKANQFVPFDAAMLSTRMRDRSARSFMRRWVAGRFPLLTQGWSFLDPADRNVNHEVYSLRNGLVPSLWTTFREPVGLKLASLLRDGVI